MKLTLFIFHQTKKIVSHYSSRSYHSSFLRNTKPNAPFIIMKCGSDTEENGGAYRIRTGDLYNANSPGKVLADLSQGPK